MNNSEYSTLILSQDDVIKSGCLNFKKAILITENTIKDFSKGNILFPSKVSQVFDPVIQDRINCLPATLLNEKVCGMKWVSVFPNNPKKYGIDNLTAVIILSNIENGRPLAFMEGSVCSNVRTASVNAVAAKYLAKSNPHSIGFIGAGEQAKSNFLALKTLFPSIKTCYISSRTIKTENVFYNTFSDIFADVKFIKCNSNYEMCVSNSDIIVSAISGQAPIIKGSWIKNGQLYLHTGGWEDDYSVAQNADKIFCDDWDSVKHRGSQTISKMYRDGIISDSDISGNIDELISGKVIGRDNENQFIYFNAVGLSYVDIAIANNVYVECLDKGLGTNYKLKTHSMFDELDIG